MRFPLLAFLIFSGLAHAQLPPKLSDSDREKIVAAAKKDLCASTNGKTEEKLEATACTACLAAPTGSQKLTENLGGLLVPASEAARKEKEKRFFEFLQKRPYVKPFASAQRELEVEKANIREEVSRLKELGMVEAMARPPGDASLPVLHAYLERAEKIVSEEVNAIDDNIKYYEPKTSGAEPISNLYYGYRLRTATSERAAKQKQLSEIRDALKKTDGVALSKLISELPGLEPANRIQELRASIAEREKNIATLQKNLEQARTAFQASEKNLYVDPYETKKLMESVVKGVSPNDGFQTCNMSLAEQYALVLYSDTDFKYLNQGLRSGGESAAAVKPLKDVLDRGLEHLSKYEGVVLRGGTLPNQILNQHQPGQIVEYPGYTSASLVHGFLANTRHKFAIRSKSGRYIAPLSTHPGEEEVLFPAGTRFKVLSREELTDGTIEFTMEEVE